MESDRSVRIFVSSTFRDMQVERERLTKHVFPVFRAYCRERGYGCVEVDLRWGIPDEVAAERAVLSLCIAEVRRCQPFFIACLGERYGWIPDKVPADLIAREPWLARYAGRSVTEIEILCGALLPPAAPAPPPATRCALFYLRSPDYPGSAAPFERAAFQEVPSAEDEARFGNAAFVMAEDRRRKLADLKKRIRSSGHAVTSYADPAEFGELVLRDLVAHFHRLYPGAQDADAQEPHDTAQESYATRRTQVYVGREQDLAVLDAAVAHEPGLLIVGESGVGKSALLAHWIQTRAARALVPVVAHYLGASPQSADWASMIKRLVASLQVIFQLPAEPSNSPEQLQRSLLRLLDLASERGGLVLVLDGIDQLTGDEGAADLSWLPMVPPSGVRLIVSAQPGPAERPLRQRGWRCLELARLATDEQTRLIVEYLALYGKQLPAAQLQVLTASPEVGNPLFARTLLQELLVHGNPLTLEKTVADYLRARSTLELFTKILARYEQDYDSARPGLVRDVFRFICVARQGLSEFELVAMLSASGREVPRVDLSSLLVVARDGFVVESDLMRPAHAEFRHTVEQRYMPDESARWQTHLEFAESFKGVLVRRVLVETPWHLREAGAWERLHDAFLADQLFAAPLMRNHTFATQQYWREVEAHTEHTIEQTYRRFLDGTFGPMEAFDAGVVAKFLLACGRSAEAAKAYAHIAARHEPGKSSVWVLNNQALALGQSGDRVASLALYRELRTLCEPDSEELAICWLNQSQMMPESEGEESLSLLEKAQAIFKRKGKPESVVRCLAARAQHARRSGDVLEENALLNEAEAVSVQEGLMEGLAPVLGQRGRCHLQLGRLDEAARCFERSKRIWRQFGAEAQAQEAAIDEGNVLAELGKIDKALAVFDESIRICIERALHDHHVVALTLKAHTLREGGRLEEAALALAGAETTSRAHGAWEHEDLIAGHNGLLAHRQGRPAEADAMLREAEVIARRKHSGRAATWLGWRGMVAQEEERFAEARDLLIEAETLYRRGGDIRALVQALRVRAGVCERLGEPSASESAREEAESLCRRLGLHAELLRILRASADACFRAGQYRKAAEKLAEVEQHARSAGATTVLIETLIEQGKAFHALGAAEAANAKLDEASRIARDENEPDAIGMAAGVRAFVKRATGDAAGALAAFTEEEQIAEHQQDAAGVIASMNNQALFFMASNDLTRALELLQRARARLESSGDEKALSRVLGNIATIQGRQGMLDEAESTLLRVSQLAQKAGDRALIAHTHGNRGGLLLARQRFAAAAEQWRRSIEVYGELGDRTEAALSRAGLAATLAAAGRIDEALVEAHLALDARTEAPRPETIAQWDASLAKVLGALTTVTNELLRSDFRAALPRLLEQEKFARRLGDKNTLQTALGNIAQCLAVRGEPEVALRLHAEEAAICRELGDHVGLAASLTNQVRCCEDLGRREDALLAAAEGLRSAAVAGDGDLAKDLQEQFERLAKKIMEAVANDARVGELVRAKDRCQRLEKAAQLVGANGALRWTSSMLRELRKQVPG